MQPRRNVPGLRLMPPRITRAQVLALIAKWQARLGLEAWAIRVVMTTKMDDFADFGAQPEYMEAVLRVHPVKTTPDTLESILVHELIHAHTWPLWEAAEDAARGNPAHLRRIEKEHERLTSTLQRIVMR